MARVLRQTESQELEGEILVFLCLIFSRRRSDTRGGEATQDSCQKRFVTRLIEHFRLLDEQFPVKTSPAVQMLCILYEL